MGLKAILSLRFLEKGHHKISKTKWHTITATTIDKCIKAIGLVHLADLRLLSFPLNQIQAD